MGNIIIPESKVYSHRGEFGVELHIPPSSSLSDRDIETILALSSLETDPNSSNHFEGMRSVLIPKETPIDIRGQTMTALQISGIGSKSFDWLEGERLSPQSDLFLRPTADNVMPLFPGTKMSTGHYEGGKVKVTRPTYRAFGTYTSDELETKVKNTAEIAGISFEKFVTPTVEAYGWFTDPIMSKNGKSFGFGVFSAPDTQKPRVAETLQELMINANSITNLGIVKMAIFDYLNRIGDALRELHQHGITHHQPHLGNWYMRKKPILADWATFRRNRTNPLEILGNRMQDVEIPVANTNNLLTSCGFDNRLFGALFVPTLIWSHYAGTLPRYVDIAHYIMKGEIQGKFEAKKASFDLMKAIQSNRVKTIDYLPVVDQPELKRVYREVR